MASYPSTRVAFKGFVYGWEENGSPIVSFLGTHFMKDKCIILFIFIKISIMMKCTCMLSLFILSSCHGNYVDAIE